MAVFFGATRLGCTVAQAVLFTAAVALLALASFSSLDRSQHPRTSGSFSLKVSSAGQATATTGQLFTGERVRAYQGPVLLSADNNATQSQPNTVFSQGFVSDKWAVVTTIFKPSDAILSAVAMAGWAVVIVGDKDGYPIQLQAPNVVILDAEAQEKLGHPHIGLSSLLPWNHFGRKNIGYLYAIAHGAQYIWDFDDDNILKDGVQPRVPSRDIYHVQVDPGCDIFNPYPNMGAPEGAGTWPRGLPLSLIRAPCNHTVVVGNMSSVAVVQSLADHEPDVDGIFRLTRTTPFAFDPKHKRTLVVPKNVLSPYNAQAALVLLPAFFTQLLPVTVHGRVSDIWRSYIAQRLLWDVGYQIAFAPPMVTQNRNPHNPLADMHAEEPLYFQSLALVRYLKQWRGTAPTIAGRFEELVTSLYERQYLEIEDVKLTQQWLLALQAIGYSFPPISSQAAVTTLQQLPLPECATRTTVFVTGVNGMIGSHVARVLATKSCYTIYGLVRPRSNLDTLVGILDAIQLVVGDITDAPRMLDLMEQLRPQYVYHFAAQAINGISNSMPEMTLDTNVIGTLNLLEALRRHALTETRVLMAGSSTEYGRTADVWNGPIPETAPLEPVSPYGVSKVTTENLGHQYHLAYGMPVITARFFIQVGIGGTDTLAIHEFCKQIALAEVGQGPSIIKHGNLDTKRDMSDMRDTAPVVVALLEKGVAGEAYNIGSGKLMTIKDLLTVAVGYAKVKITAQEDPSRFRAYDEKKLLADVSKIRKLTGWRPNTDMSATVATILDYWRHRVSVLYPSSRVPVPANSSILGVATTYIPASITPSMDGRTAQIASQQALMSEKSMVDPAQACPTSNIDVFLVAGGREFPLLAMTINSIKFFMPCRGHTHILVDAPNAGKVGAWVDLSDPKMHIHTLTVPDALSSKTPGYVHQAWVMFWADKIARTTGSSPDYIMYVDTDSVVALPITCSSVFDSEGRLYIAGWPIDAQPQFRESCRDLLGTDCPTSYMSFMPFVYPTAALGRLRKHITATLPFGDDFDAAFAAYAGEYKTKTGQAIDWNWSQFVIMGTYLEKYENSTVHVIKCPMYGAHAGSECASWLPVGVHFGWRYCSYLGSCPPGRSNVNLYHSSAHGDLSVSNKFSGKSVALVEALIDQGHALMKHLSDGHASDRPEALEALIHPELRPYPTDNVTAEVLHHWALLLVPDTQGTCGGALVHEMHSISNSD